MTKQRAFSLDEDRTLLHQSCNLVFVIAQTGQCYLNFKSFVIIFSKIDNFSKIYPNSVNMSNFKTTQSNFQILAEIHFYVLGRHSCQYLVMYSYKTTWLLYIYWNHYFTYFILAYKNVTNNFQREYFGKAASVCIKGNGKLRALQSTINTVKVSSRCW